MKTIFISLLSLLLLPACGGSAARSKRPAQTTPAAAHAQPKTYTYRIVATYPHSTEAYTQGLYYDGGLLWEGTGQHGESRVQTIDLTTGKTNVLARLPRSEFGEGIARCLIQQGANIVVADLNETVGAATAERLNGMARSNRAIFVKTNVADTESLRNLIHETVCRFGGLDVFVSNAGVLRAGGLEEMTPENFEFVTKINYNAYFYCAQAASRVMKLQNKYAEDNYGDIIQINSKSGLRGSKANFAYAGGKFGGVGLTQSFALELAPFRIKVNAVCPGNFYEGPLWSNPENGLFLQYLHAGKVPGAKTVEDVRKYYMDQVPMRKGTGPEDVTKAVLYLIEQTCETGQAVPVTGGQVMLS